MTLIARHVQMRLSERLAALESVASQWGEAVARTGEAMEKGTAQVRETIAVIEAIGAALSERTHSTLAGAELLE